MYRADKGAFHACMYACLFLLLHGRMFFFTMRSFYGWIIWQRHSQNANANAGLFTRTKDEAQRMQLLCFCMLCMSISMLQLIIDTR